MSAESTIKIVIDYFEYKHIPVDTPSIAETVTYWSNRLEGLGEIDEYALAAIAIENPPKNFAISKTRLRELEEKYFPEIFLI